MEPIRDSPLPGASNGKDRLKYTLPEELPVVNEGDLIVWKGHLTKLGLNSLNDFQVRAIKSVQLR